MSNADFEALLGRPPTDDEALFKEHIDRLASVIDDVESLTKILNLTATLEGQELLDALEAMEQQPKE